MKIQHVTTLLALVLLSSACSLRPYYQAMSDPDVNEVKATETMEFKHAFRHLLSQQERYRLKRTVIDQIEFDNRGEKNAQRTASSAGVSYATNGGIATMAALDVTADIINAYTAQEVTSQLLMSDAWLGQTNLTAEEAFSIARQKSVEALFAMAKAHDYAIVCTYNCDNANFRTFELTDLRERVTYTEVTPLNHRPYKLVANFVVSIPTDINSFKDNSNHEVDYLLYKDKYRFIAPVWSISLAEPYKADKNIPVDYRENIISEDVSDWRSYGQENMIENPLGRAMYRTLAKNLPMWRSGGKFFMSKLAIYNGEVYLLKGGDDFRELRGYLTHD